jgi:pimeloyl-ACP methyl ester carboxylesterase
VAAGPAKPEPFAIEASDGVSLAGEELAPPEGAGPPILLLHGLTATRRYVVHGSRVLPRRGLRALSYDARGHGESAPSPGGYDYELLAGDAGAVLDRRVGEGRAILAGHSMGAHTAAAFALSAPERVAAAVFIGPGVVGEAPSDETKAYWDRLADGLEGGGVEGFLAAYEGDLNPDWRETILRFTRERMEAHRHPEAVARALREVPRAVPFGGLGALERLDVPVLVVASHDVADPGHPYDVAAAWAEHLPSARFISEEPGESPLAWQGGRLSHAIADFCEEPAVRRSIAG